MPNSRETFARSALKTLSYRVFIVALDFVTIYLFTHKRSIALGFTIASNAYTTGAYLLHERIWGRVTWGRRPDSVLVADPSGMSGRALMAPDLKERGA